MEGPGPGLSWHTPLLLTPNPAKLKRTGRFGLSKV